MSDSFKKQIATIREQMGWVSHALQYTYDNCDENSEFFEMVCDARLLFMQANKGLENLLQLLPVESLSDQDTPTPRTE